MSANNPTFDAGAAAYDRFTGRWSLAFRSTLLAAARVATGQTVLDVAAGTGVLAELAAARVGESGRVIATDISAPMLRVTRAKVAGLPVDTVVMDGQALACRDRSVDAVVCQLGLMFFPDPLRGLEEFRRVLRPGGRIALQVWSRPDRVPFYGLLADALKEAARQQGTGGGAVCVRRGVRPGLRDLAWSGVIVRPTGAQRQGGRDEGDREGPRGHALQRTPPSEQTDRLHFVSLRGQSG